MKRLPVAVFLLLSACKSPPSPGGEAQCQIANPPEARTQCQKVCETLQACPDGPPADSCVEGCTSDYRDLKDCVQCYLLHGCEGQQACTETCSACDTDADCKGGRVCSSNGYCVTPECTAATDCACVGSCKGGQCDPPECFSDSDCFLNEVCQERACVLQPCKADPDCRSGKCTTQEGTCEFVPVSCKTAADCQRSETCDSYIAGSNDRYCMAIDCDTAADCPAGTRCGLEHFCRP